MFFVAHMALNYHVIQWCSKSFIGDPGLAEQLSQQYYRINIRCGWDDIQIRSYQFCWIILHNRHNVEKDITDITLKKSYDRNLYHTLSYYDHHTTYMSCFEITLSCIDIVKWYPRNGPAPHRGCLLCHFRRIGRSLRRTSTVAMRPARSCRG